MIVSSKQENEINTSAVYFYIAISGKRFGTDVRLDKALASSGREIYMTNTFSSLLKLVHSIKLPNNIQNYTYVSF